MLGGQSLKSLYPTKIKDILTERYVNQYPSFVKVLEENHIRIDTSWIFWHQYIRTGQNPLFCLCYMGSVLWSKLFPPLFYIFVLFFYLFCTETNTLYLSYYILIIFVLTIFLLLLYYFLFLRKWINSILFFEIIYIFNYNLNLATQNCLQTSKNLVFLFLLIKLIILLIKLILYSNSYNCNFAMSRYVYIFTNLA